MEENGWQTCNRVKQQRDSGEDPMSRAIWRFTTMLLNPHPEVHWCLGNGILFFKLYVWIYLCGCVGEIKLAEHWAFSHYTLSLLMGFVVEIGSGFFSLLITHSQVSTISNPMSLFTVNYFFHLNQFPDYLTIIIWYFSDYFAFFELNRNLNVLN